jgi:hypothetical protein
MMRPGTIEGWMKAIKPLCALLGETKSDAPSAQLSRRDIARLAGLKSGGIRRQ